MTNHPSPAGRPAATTTDNSTASLAEDERTHWFNVGRRMAQDLAPITDAEVATIRQIIGTDRRTT